MTYAPNGGVLEAVTERTEGRTYHPPVAKRRPICLIQVAHRYPLTRPPFSVSNVALAPAALLSASAHFLGDSFFLVFKMVFSFVLAHFPMPVGTARFLEASLRELLRHPASLPARGPWRRFR
ncbi:hypothetical protein MRX96_056643 [Rhipicephalus microplus]